MGVGKTFAEAYGKATRATGVEMPQEGCAFLSVKDADKALLPPIAKELASLGFEVCATRGTAEFLEKQGIEVQIVNKVNEGRPHIVDWIKNGKVQMVINTSALGVHEVGAAYELRRTTLMRNLCYFTTMSAAKAGVHAIAERKQRQQSRQPLDTHCLQDR